MRRPSNVYILVAENGDIRKIGAATDPYSRARPISAQHGIKFFLEKYWYRPGCDAFIIEDAAHWLLLASGVAQPKGMGRDYFIVSGEGATSAIERAIAAWDAGFKALAC